MRVVLLIIGIVVGLIACSGGGSGPSPGPASDPGATSKLYVQKCASCHGTEGNLTMGGARRLTESTADRALIISQITHGKGTMPPFGAILTKDQIESLADHVLQFRSQP